MGRAEGQRASQEPLPLVVVPEGADQAALADLAALPGDQVHGPVSLNVVGGAREV